MYLNRRFPLLPLFALLLSLTACIGGKTPPSQFYLLEPIRTAQTSGRADSEPGRPVIALAPVRIPRYVDRPQMVTATARNTYRLSELHRWAERLDDNIARVLAQNLGVLVPADILLLNASNRARQAALKVSVHVLEFHVDPDGQAVLVAQWQIARGEEAILNRQTACREPASTTDYRAMAAALNECLNRLSRDIAQALRQPAVES